MLHIAELLIQFAILTTAVTNAIPIASLYRYGHMAGDSQLGPTDDDSSPPIQLPTAFLYYNTHYSSIVVNNNGVLSFTNGFQDFTAQSFPLQSAALIAPFWSDVDTRAAGSGLVWYRITQNATLLARAGRDVPKLLTVTDFIPQWLFIVTWDHVGYYYLHSDKTDTFQCVLATDGYQSFVMFLYADGLIQWTTGDSSGGSGGLGGIAALVGFNAGDGLMYTVVNGSQTAEIQNITLMSNVGTPGLFIYRVNNGITSASVSDINNCYTICEQNCTAANGSFYCSCRIGYELTSNQKNCSDINECSTFSAHIPCQQNCTNTIGSFYCSCDVGYGLAVDGRECNDFNECLPNEGLGPCQQMCNNTNRSFFCSCRTGYIIGADQRTCFDMDECSSYDGLGPCETNCTNTIGSFYCSCDIGYALDESNCNDINECSPNEGLGPCQQMCVNTNGSFFCGCSAGYMLGFSQSDCLDIDECSSNGGRGPCQQTCTNTIGSFYCSCDDGHMLAEDEQNCKVASGSASTNQSQICKDSLKTEIVCCNDQDPFIPLGDLCNDTQESTCLQCPCKNGVLCKVCSYNGSTPSFACQCNSRSTGQYCKNDGYNLDILLPSAITPTIVLFVVLCIFVMSLIFIFNKRRHRKGKRKEDSFYLQTMDVLQKAKELGGAERAQ